MLALRFMAALMAGWLVFLWPTLVNGGAFFLADTTAYMRGADALVERVSGRTTSWSDETRKVIVRPTPKVSTASPTDAPRVVLAGRSIYYGIILYCLAAIGGFVAMAVFQAAICVAGATLAALRIGEAVGRPMTPTTLGLVLVLTGLGTSVGFFAGYMVPDLFAALGALALASLIAFRGILARWEKWTWWFILAVSLCVHSANLLIFILVAAIVAVALWLAKRPHQFPLMMIGGALVVALAAEFSFAVGVEGAIGQRPVRPPFVAARLIDDGPGRDYLRERCGGSTFLLCEWRDRIPSGSDTILWSDAPGIASFSSASSAEKRRLAKEEIPFIFAVVVDRPFAVVRGSLKTIGKQAAQWSLSEFNTDPAARAWFKRKIPAQELVQIERTAAWSGTMPVGVATWAIRISFTIAFVFAALAIFGRTVGVPGRVRLFLAILIVAIGCDILVTGLLSTPHDRYLVRITWILPFAMLTVFTTSLLARLRSPSASSVTSPRPA